MPTIHLLIEGKVQGVFFRVSARKEAEKLGINGWIKNTPNGHVEAVASGEANALTAFEKWCSRGPKEAVVTEVTVSPMQETSFSRFQIIR